MLGFSRRSKVQSPTRKRRIRPVLIPKGSEDSKLFGEDSPPLVPLPPLPLSPPSLTLNDENAMPPPAPKKPRLPKLKRQFAGTVLNFMQKKDSFYKYVEEIYTQEAANSHQSDEFLEKLFECKCFTWSKPSVYINYGGEMASMWKNGMKVTPKFSLSNLLTALQGKTNESKHFPMTPALKKGKGKHGSKFGYVNLYTPVHLYQLTCFDTPAILSTMYTEQRQDVNMKSVQLTFYADNGFVCAVEKIYQRILASFQAQFPSNEFIQQVKKQWKQAGKHFNAMVTPMVNTYPSVFKYNKHKGTSYASLTAKFNIRKLKLYEQTHENTFKKLTKQEETTTLQNLLQQKKKRHRVYVVLNFKGFQYDSVKNLIKPQVEIIALGSAYEKPLNKEELEKLKKEDETFQFDVFENQESEKIVAFEKLT